MEAGTKRPGDFEQNGQDGIAQGKRIKTEIQDEAGNGMEIEEPYTRDADAEAEVQKQLLRENIQQWLARYPKMDEQTVVIILKELADLRNEEDNAYELWHSEVCIYEKYKKE